jgi:hypothetical protein
MFAQNVLSSDLYGHTVVKVFDLTAHPPVYAGFGRTGRTKRMEPSLASALRAAHPPPRWAAGVPMERDDTDRDEPV